MYGLITYARLAPTGDAITDGEPGSLEFPLRYAANILETVTSILKKVSEEEAKSDKVLETTGNTFTMYQKAKWKFPFTKGADLGRERALLQYACLYACRQRFKSVPSLFPVMIQMRFLANMGSPSLSVSNAQILLQFGTLFHSCCSTVWRF